MMMLDIIANNNWERPIYFTGGSFGDEDYLWMKYYLQLDGVVYKLVPIRTPVDRRNPFDMGRIDSEKMFDVVMKWSWGNSGSPDIYHDPETRKNSITYRSNIARLAETLIRENKLEKAEKVLDLAMEKMPVEYFGYYTLLEPYVSGYMQVNKPEKAKMLYEKLAKKYQERLTYFSGMNFEQQRIHFEMIFTDIERYRSLVDTLLHGEDEAYFREKAEEFNTYLKLFRHFYGQEEPEERTIDEELQELREVPELDEALETRNKHKRD
jgi:hypothetical protein